MKKHLMKTIIIIFLLILIVLAGIYLQGYLYERRKQSGRFIEESESISRTHTQQESNKIYQDNNVVGEIVGEVQKIDETDIFIRAGFESGRHKWINKGVGLIDSAILIAAAETNSFIWTLDNKLSKVLSKEQRYTP